MSNDINRIDKSSAMTKALFGLSMDELAAVVKGLGQPGYRGGQIAEAIYRHRVTNLSEISTLPQGLREALCAEGYSVGLPEIIQTARSVDGTERYLMRMADGETVETVWMPDGDGGERGDGSQAAQEEAGEVVAAEDAVGTHSSPAAMNGAPGSLGPGERTQISFGNDKQDRAQGSAQRSQQDRKQRFEA